MKFALVREVSASINQCELTHVERMPIDVNLARRQHAAYVDALRKHGLEVTRLPEAPDLPDSVFVEDTAVVLPEVAVITNPGADSRKPEREAVAAALRRYRRLVAIEPPATVDGGDVLVLDKDIYVGLSTRSNQAAVDQMNQALAEFGYRVHGVRVEGCLHLKSAVTRIGPRTVLLNPAWVAPETFAGFDALFVHPDEPYAANAVWLGEVLIYPSSYPQTQAMLESQGYQLEIVDVSELAKAEGAVTCCSLVFDV